ncbi:MAG TPA: ATP-binding protein [Candidatus Eisenbacteria bacterium]|nr:ATP-binding protein [Candidatus Eisenbacteria bacterium]
MFRNIPSIRLKMMLIVLITSLSALLIASIVLAVYDVRFHRISWAGDLMTQAEMVGRASAPAIVFGDSLTAHQSLALLAVRPEISAAAVYTPDGRPFATFARRPEDAVFPVTVTPSGFRFDHNRLQLFRAIEDPDGIVGTVYLSARYDLAGRLGRYLPVLTAIMLGSLAIVLAMSQSLQASVIRPVLSIARAADQVRQERNFALRVEKETNDETGKLVDAFNAMLAEVAEAERSLLESNRRKDDFLATLAHELRNPLGPIRNATQYLRYKDTHPESRQSLELIDRQVQHMVRLIEDLLDISRITRDALELRLSSFSAADLLRDVVEATQYVVEESELTLRTRNDAGPVTLYADRARLVQVASNIVNNAVKFTPAGGAIDLVLARQRRNLIVTVTDTGIGIPPERLKEIFEPFSQLDRSLEKTRGGLGIGLALSQRLIALHGGTIEARSEGPGRGSAFHIELPIVSDEPIPAPAVAPLPITVTDGHRILVADDNVDGAASLGLLLKAMGHQVTVAHNGAEALEKLDVNGFEAAILDIGMPRINGYDLARMIRARGHKILLVALTGWGQAEDKRRAFDAGFDTHLTKPVQTDQLAHALSVLKERKLREG